MQLASIMVKRSHADEYRDQIGRVAKCGAQLPRAGKGPADLGEGWTLGRPQGPGANQLKLQLRAVAIGRDRLTLQDRQPLSACARASAYADRSAACWLARCQ